MKVLQYRSVAFVTYKSEFHAQFAKEAMACQSLDNDEILNVRWATEDPNPVSKVNEKRRLEDMGQEAIRSKMDPRIVDAMRTIRALEDGDSLEDESYRMLEEMEEDNGEPQAKRLKLDSGNDAPPPASTGLLNPDTMESLKYFAEIRKREAKPRAAPTPLTGGLGLADYGSDDDDD